ncbi:MAG: leucine-rich repeat domain-containing protein [Prevotella sp.]|nr:leucine-rich repeat domain-containing protein [Prevotella sp.]
MRKKLLSILALLCLTVSGAWADDSGSCGTSLTYSYVESTHTLTISGSGAMTKYDLFMTKAPWNAYKSSITSVVIESGVTSIGEYAFNQCANLASVTIPTGVTSIGRSAFEQCSSLTTIDIPVSVTTIGNGAFGRTGLTEIDIPASVTTLGSSVFMSCTNLTTVSIPTSVTSIGQSVFYGCSNLKSANLPDNLTSIPSQLFYQCTSLEAITIPASVTSIESQAFRNCTGLTSIDLPANLTTIGVYAFSGCNNASLTSISIPASVTSIGQSAFRNCSNLGTVTLNSNPTIGTDAFTGIADGAAVTMNLTANSAGGAYWMTFYNQNYDFEADANTQIFKAALSEDKLTQTELEEDQIVTKNNAVILKSTAGTITMTLTSTASSNDFSGNSLLGVSDAAGLTAADPSTTYVLNDGSQGVGFYRLQSGETIGVGKAYLTSNSSSDFLTFATETTYSIALADDTEDADNWEITPAEATTTGVAEGETVTLKYSGDREVKSITVKKK